VEVDANDADPEGTGAVTMVLVVMVVVVVLAETHLPPFNICPNLLGQILQAAPPSL
jgi:hypothetical protein